MATGTLYTTDDRLFPKRRRLDNALFEFISPVL